MSENPDSHQAYQAGPVELPLGDPRRRPIGHGWRWIKEAWPLFAPAWGRWLLAMLLFVAIFIGLEVIPLIGSVISMLLTPVLSAGMLYMAYQAREGGEVNVADLFAAFRQRPWPLVGLGAINIAVSFVIMVVVMGGIFGTSSMNGMAGMHGGGGFEPHQMANASMALMLGPLIILALMVPWMMAYWFSVPLVFFGNYGIGEALKTSFRACLRNILPMFWWSLIGVLLGIVAAIPLLLGLLVLFPVLLIANYIMFRDIFSET
ncbi:BPSS1780 family membrane protein [Vreelandella utahensis]|uniref:BPSS1780 family membrane protein n=1 Tax=Vreelandella halophila TaxID=86177 RepID=UPI0009853CEE|nr:BPSS1780 family membrane protein [Halomonas utahensis]